MGETVAPMSSLVKISDLTNVELYIYVSELELGKIKLGQKAEVSVDAFKERNLKVKLSISPLKQSLLQRISKPKMRELNSSLLLK